MRFLITGEHCELGDEDDISKFIQAIINIDSDNNDPSQSQITQI
jgi:hypothetical protein